MLENEKRIHTRKDLQRFLSAELVKYGRTSTHGLFFPFLERDILAKHAILLRKAEYHVNNGHKIRGILFRVRLQLLQNKYAIHVPLNCCDEGLKIMHVGPVLINGNAKIGKNCSIHINTGIVAGGLSSDAPVLGDGVVVGIGTVILGKVTVANYVAIGANAVVNKSIEQENVAVAGVPAKIISNHGRLEWNKK